MNRPDVFVSVPRGGFSDARARRLLGLSCAAFAALQADLVFGDWTMRGHRLHIMRGGMEKMARAAGRRGLRFVGAAKTGKTKQLK